MFACGSSGRSIGKVGSRRPALSERPRAVRPSTAQSSSKEPVAVPPARKPDRKTSAKPAAAAKPKKPASKPKAASAKPAAEKPAAKKPTVGKAKASRKTARTPRTAEPATTLVAADAKDSDHFGKARNRAERLLRDPEAAERLADDAEEKIAKKRSKKLTEVIHDVRALIRLIRAYAAGDYRAIKWESMVLVVAGIVYLVSPLDLIPDFLPGGLADDAVIVAFVVGMVHEELVDFREWEQSQDEEA